MARTCLRSLLGACLVPVLLCGPLPAGDADQRQKTLLAVQVALEQGQEFLQKADFAAAVAVLEKQLTHIDGNRRYLSLLRDAYRGYVRQLEDAGRQAEAKKYRGFLDILDPPSRGAATAAPASKGAPQAISRGKIKDEDPFAESNGLASQRGLIGRADQAFEERNYEVAARLYAQAERGEPGCAASSQERWAYCRLVVVARTLERSKGDFSTQEMEQEVRQALRMAPKLSSFGQNILDRLQGAGKEKDEPVDVKHTPRKDNGWAIVETANFRIFHAVPEETAEKMARIAEATRVSMTRKWFAEDAQPWSPRCDIYVHPTGQGYSKATGAPAASPGHSSISLEGSRVVVRRVDLRGDDPNLLIGVLPHETTHVVLAGRFGTHHVPRWADEGMAVLSEPRQRIDLHLRNLPTHQREGGLFAAGELMKMAEYPEPRRIGPFYAQSVSLVDFLCKKKDPATFTRFLREALDGKYELALERHYGYRSFADLDREWKEHAFGDGSVAAVAEKQR